MKQTTHAVIEIRNTQYIVEIKYLIAGDNVLFLGTFEECKNYIS